MLRRELLVDQYEAIAMYMKATQTMTISQGRSWDCPSYD